MTLLDQIVEGATEGAPVLPLLRKLRIVAAEADAQNFVYWIDQELGGYSQSSSLPNYRGPFQLQVIGFPRVRKLIREPQYGRVRSAQGGISLPRARFSRQIQESELFTAWLGNPIAELTELEESGTQRIPWPVERLWDLNRTVSDEQIRRVLGVPRRPDRADQSHMEPEHRSDRNDDVYYFSAADTVVDGAIFRRALDGVRNQIVAMAAELGRYGPESGRQDSDGGPRDQGPTGGNQYNFYGPSSGNAFESPNPQWHQGRNLWR